MSYQVLARKWRPRSFDTLVGQEHVVRALTHALTDGRLHHAYLFTGTRGVGKTTLARILAKALNCEAGVSPAPCGQCSACTEIDAGRFVDMLEVDAATNTRVDEMRQLLENAVYAPTRGRYKVYVIDEVHMLSNSAFNAMLKTLEEPPEHVKFILATTDPQKIPVTVLSRCMQFNLKQMPPAAIKGHLAHIVAAEAVPHDAAALGLLARSAAGSMRDALSLLDQAIAHGAGQVDVTSVQAMLGAVDSDYLFRVLEALPGADAAAMVAIAGEMLERGLSFDVALQELAALLTRVQLAQLASGGEIDPSAPDAVRVAAIAAALDPEAVQLAYQIAIHGRKELPLAPDEYAGCVMTFLRLCAFVPDAGGTGSVPRRPVAVSSVAREAAVLQSPAPSPVAAEPIPQPNSPEERVRPAVAVSTGRVAQPTVASPLSADGWRDILARLPLSGMARELAHHCELVEAEAGRIVLRLSPTHRHLNLRSAQERVQEALSAYWKTPQQLRIEEGRPLGVTPAAARAQENKARQEGAVAAIEADDFVRDAIEIFDARLIDSSIKPI